MYSGIPVAALMNDSGLIPAHIMLNFRQRMYAHRLLSLPDFIPTKDILPITLQVGKINAQPEDQPKLDIIQASDQHITIYGQQPVRQVSVRFSIDPAKETEPICSIPNSVFPRQLIIDDKKKVIFEVKGKRGDLKFWCDGSKPGNGDTGAAVVWETDRVEKKWHKQKGGLGLNKEIFDVEIWSISEALKIVERKAQ